MRFASLLFCLSLSALGCGGSSSETPPPLQPDPTSERYTGPRMPSAADDVAQAPAPEPEDDGLDQPRKPALATWGSGKPAPGPSAPRMTSPTAVPASSATATPAPSTTPAPSGSAAPPKPSGAVFDF